MDLEAVQEAEGQVQAVLGVEEAEEAGSWQEAVEGSQFLIVPE